MALVNGLLAEVIANGWVDAGYVQHIAGILAEQREERAERLEPFAARYGDEESSELDVPHCDLVGGVRSGPLGLLRDLNDLYLLACECELAWTLVGQAARGALLVSGLQLRWLAPSDRQAVALILIAFMAPLQLPASISASWPAMSSLVPEWTCWHQAGCPAREDNRRPSSGSGSEVRLGRAAGKCGD